MAARRGCMVYPPLRYTVYLPQIRAQPLKSTWKNSKGKTGTQTVSKDYPRPGFLMGAVLKCYAVERRFKGEGINPFPFEEAVVRSL